MKISNRKTRNESTLYVSTSFIQFNPIRQPLFEYEYFILLIRIYSVFDLDY